MSRAKFSLSKSGVLPILWLLSVRGEVRFTHFGSQLTIPRRTIAVRLAELTKAGLLERREHSDGMGSIAFTGYSLTDSGRKLVNRIGAKSMQRLMEAEKEFG
jgi:DNA-binding HxlR family transcriptional regulator